MNELTTTNNLRTIQTQTLQQSYYDEFIRYIDREPATMRTYIKNMRQFAAWLAYSGISAPTRQDIINYRQYLAAEHDAIKLDPASPCGWSYRTDANGNRLQLTCGANTIKQYLQTVRQFFAWTEAAGYYPNIAKNIHGPKIRQDIHRKEALSAADVLTVENSIADTAKAAIQAAANSQKDTAGKVNRSIEQGKRLRAMYMLSVTAGMRTIELSRANIKDIETKNGQAFIYIHGKGHAEADDKKPLARPVYDALQDYINSRSDEHTEGSPLFVATGNRSGGQRLAPTTISTMLKSALVNAGYRSDRLTAHSLRHTAGTIAQELTGNIYLTQKYMRHKNPRTTEIYLHNDTMKQEADIAEKLYNEYHATTDTRQQLAQILTTMDAETVSAMLQAAQELQDINKK